jgi:hypothetical protein
VRRSSRRLVRGERWRSTPQSFSSVDPGAHQSRKSVVRSVSMRRPGRRASRPTRVVSRFFSRDRRCLEFPACGPQIARGLNSRETPAVSSVACAFLGPILDVGPRVRCSRRSNVGPAFVREGRPKDSQRRSACGSARRSDPRHDGDRAIPARPGGAAEGGGVGPGAGVGRRGVGRPAGVAGVGPRGTISSPTVLRSRRSGTRCARAPVAMSASLLSCTGRSATFNPARWLSPKLFS